MSFFTKLLPVNVTGQILLKLVFTFGLPVIFLASCKNVPSAASEKRYFDLTGFLDKQVELLYRDSFIVLKTSSINNNTDQHEMPWADWRKELAIFYASDINKAAYGGKYKTDTILLNGTEKKISFISTDPSLRTRLLEVTYAVPEDAVKLIHISNYTHNVIATNSEELYFEPLNTYIIKSNQEMIFFGTTNLAVKGDFVKKKRNYF